MAIYQLIPGIFHKQMEQFDRNEFLFSENGSLKTKNARHNP